MAPGEVATVGSLCSQAVWTARQLPAPAAPGLCRMAPGGGKLWSFRKLTADAPPSRRREREEPSGTASWVWSSSPVRACEFFSDKSRHTHTLTFGYTSACMPSVWHLARNRDISRLQPHDAKSYIIYFWSSSYYFCKAREEKAGSQRLTLHGPCRWPC